MKWVFSYFLHIISFLISIYSATVLTPFEDPFYVPPNKLDDYNPGDIIRYRDTPAPLYDYEEVERAIQILYRTNDAQNISQATVTTIIIPTNANFSQLVSYQSYEDSVYSACAPSYSFQLADGSDQLVQPLLYSGWIVNVPDYEGPESACSVGYQAGYATLDSIRACLNSVNFTGINSDVTIVMTGYSGGALATGWAAQLQPSYAPDLYISGAVFGGFPVNVTSTALAVNNGPHAGLIAVGMLGMSAAYPSFNKTLYDNLFPSNSSRFLQASYQCLKQILSDFADQDVFSYFRDRECILATPGVVEHLELNTLGANPPQIPIYLWHAMKDQITPVESVDKTISQYCKAGAASIEYVKYLGLDHGDTGQSGLPIAFQRVHDIFSGFSPIRGCSTIITDARDSLKKLSSSFSSSSATIVTTTGLLAR